jgi:hypothetical protein
MAICGFNHTELLTRSSQKIFRFVASVDYRTMGWYDSGAFPP